VTSIDKQLELIQEDQISEFIDPLSLTLMVGTGLVVKNLIILFLSAAAIKKQTKYNAALTKRVNNILKSGDKWIVHVYHDKSPNAFSLGYGRHLFVTSGLFKLLSDEEVDAVLLHEAYHSQAKHTPKKLAYQYPLYYLVVFVGLSITIATGGLFILGVLAMLIMNSVSDIPYNITMGRRHERKADDYAVTNGYGKQLASSLKKIEVLAAKHARQQRCEGLCKVIQKINEAIDEHPPLQKRIETVLRKTKELEAVMKSVSFKKIKNFVMSAWGK